MFVYFIEVLAESFTVFVQTNNLFLVLFNTDLSLFNLLLECDYILATGYIGHPSLELSLLFLENLELLLVIATLLLVQLLSILFLLLRISIVGQCLND